MTSKNKISVSCQNCIYFFDQADLMYCKSKNGYTHLYLQDGQEYLLCKSLTKFSKELTSFSFIRISQSYLVNTLFIKLIDKRSKLIELEDKTRIPYTAKTKDLLQLMNLEEEGQEQLNQAML